MKKLYLLFLMLLIMFIPVTHSIAIYQLDQPIKELNNYTLREVFENRNIAMPYWNGAPLIEPNTYRVYSANGITIDYNVINGVYIMNGTSSTIFAYIYMSYTNKPLTISHHYVSGTKTDLLTFNIVLYNNGSSVSPITNIYNTYHVINDTSSNEFGIYVINLSVYTNYKFQLQLEYGETSTPFQVPKNGIHSEIDVSQFGLSNNQIQTYYDLYLEAVRFELENQEARQDEGGYQNIFKSILDGVKNLMQEMGNVWNFLNAPIITNDMQNYQPPAIDWSWDIIGVVRQIVNNANTLAFQLLFVVPSLIYSLLGIPIHISLLSLLFSNLIFLLLGWIVVKSFII